MLTEDGASVTFCSYLEAPYTDGMSSKSSVSSPRESERSSASVWAGTGPASRPRQNTKLANVTRFTHFPKLIVFLRLREAVCAP
jgi:hypothetical protein